MKMPSVRRTEGTYGKEEKKGNIQWYIPFDTAELISPRLFFFRFKSH
jgi:hypothetical protein